MDGVRSILVCDDIIVNREVLVILFTASLMLIV